MNNCTPKFNNSCESIYKGDPPKSPYIAMLHVDDLTPSIRLQNVICIRSISLDLLC